MCGLRQMTCEHTHVACWDVWHDAFMCVTWLTAMVRERLHGYTASTHMVCVDMCDTTHSYVRHDASVCVTRRIRMCDTTHFCVWHDAFICVTRLTATEWESLYDRQHTHGVCWYVWHGAFLRVTRRICMCDTTHLCVWHDAFLCVTRRIHICDTTRSYVWHHSNGAREIARAHTNVVRVQLTCVCVLICVTWPMHMWDMTHPPAPSTATERERLHGHTHVVRVQLTGPVAADGRNSMKFTLCKILWYLPCKMKFYEIQFWKLNSIKFNL